MTTLVSHGLPLVLVLAAFLTANSIPSRLAFLPATTGLPIAKSSRLPTHGPSPFHSYPSNRPAFSRGCTSSEAPGFSFSKATPMSTVPSLFKISGGGNTSRPPASSTKSILPSTPRTRRVVAWVCALATLLLMTTATSVPRALAAAVEHGEHLHLGQRVAKAIGTRTGWPNSVTLMAISALPVVELRGGVPVGLWMGIPAAQTFLLACLGNLIPVPLILLVLRNTPWLMEKVTPVLEKKLKDTTGAKMNWQALAIFVGVPLPGTGAWTGAAIAALFKLSYAESFLGIVVGILSAAAIMTALVKAGMWGAIAVGGGLLVSFAAQQLGERKGKK